MNEYFFHTSTQLPYADLLQKDEWKIKKAQIIARDNNRCSYCGKSGVEAPLEVHHLFYAEGLDPWEYPDESLITLCSDCHEEWHKKNGILCAEKIGDSWELINKVPCQRCNGVGYLHQYDYYYDGICFRCWGERFEGRGSNIRLFTESQGKTPQEYFDVFSPLTDDNVIRIYTVQRQRLSPLLRLDKVSYFMRAEVWRENGHTQIKLLADTGAVFTTFLDYSMLNIVNNSDLRYLNIKTLLFKECMNQYHQKYIIVKGDLISYEEAKQIMEEIRNAREH